MTVPRFTRKGLSTAAVLCVAVYGCATQAAVPVRPDTEQSLRIGPPSVNETSLMWLAREWAGSTGDALCGSPPPFGDPLWFPGGRYCGIVTSNRGVVGFQLDSRGIVHAVTWHRNTASPSDAERITDSLDVVLRGRRMTARPCEPGSSPAGEVEAAVWEADDLLVFLSRITPDTMPPKLVAMAVDVPAAFPQFLCKPVRPGPARPRASLGTDSRGST